LAVEAWKGLYQSIRSTQNANGRCDMASHKEGKKSVQILLNAKIEITELEGMSRFVPMPIVLA